MALSGIIYVCGTDRGLSGRACIIELRQVLLFVVLYANCQHSTKTLCA